MRREEGKALVIQQVAHEGLGIIAPELLRASLRPEYVRVYRGEPVPRTASGYCAVIVLGGPMGVYEEDIYPFIGPEIRLLESALKERVPTLGICLGAQLLARAAGARVYRGKAKEIGYYTVELTREGKGDRLVCGFPEKFGVFQWHGDTFDVPPGAMNLASSELFSNQLIKAGPRAYGVQFHLEVTEKMVRDWITVNDRELKSLKGKIDPAGILKETPAALPAIHRLGASFVRRFLRLAL